MKNNHLRVVAANDAVPVGGALVSRDDVKRALHTGGQLAGTMAKGSFTAIRYAVFYMLMWLRILVRVVTSACAGLGLLALVLAAVFKPEWALMWKIASFSFCGFLAGWLYDGLLLWISPEPMMLDGRATE